MARLVAAALGGLVTGFAGSFGAAHLIYRRAHSRTCHNVSARTAERLVTDWRRDHPVPITGTDRERKEP